MYTFESLNKFFLKYIKIDESGSEEICPSCFYVKDGDEPMIEYVDNDLYFRIVFNETDSIVRDLLIFDVRLEKDELEFYYEDEDGDLVDDIVEIQKISSIVLVEKNFIEIKDTSVGKARKCDCGSWMIIIGDLEFSWRCYSCHGYFPVNELVVDGDKKVISVDKLRWMVLNNKEL